ncbi:hypothetical protein [Limnobacter sp.]|uniref:hypothetical protein n=1 Tax=Limnobacter sp. TaxID=2003368 RepID=UPI002736B8AB|nr:hypothetical protein [Limnobacter sp.]MDP3188699.1 hypothetical protein [Limnobacter sp.]
MALMLVASNAVPPAYEAWGEKSDKRAKAMQVNGKKKVVPRAEESIGLSPVFLAVHSLGWVA